MLAITTLPRKQTRYASEHSDCHTHPRSRLPRLPAHTFAVKCLHSQEETHLQTRTYTRTYRASHVSAALGPTNQPKRRQFHYDRIVHSFLYKGNTFHQKEICTEARKMTYVIDRKSHLQAIYERIVHRNNTHKRKHNHNM